MASSYNHEIVFKALEFMRFTMALGEGEGACFIIVDDILDHDVEMHAFIQFEVGHEVEHILGHTLVREEGRHSLREWEHGKL